MKSTGKDPYAEKTRFWTMLTAFGTWAGVIFAGIAAAAIWEQFGAMVDDAKARDAAFKVDQRAWLGFVAFEMKDNIEVGKVLSAHAIIMNSGKSPALHVQIKVAADTFCGGFPKTPTYRSLTTDDPGSVSLVMPNSPRSSGESAALAPLTTDDIAKANRADCQIYGYARAMYSDTLSNRPHWRHMCVQWIKGTPKSFVDCGAYNDGDEDYPDGKEPN